MSPQFSISLIMVFYVRNVKFHKPLTITWSLNIVKRMRFISLASMFWSRFVTCNSTGTCWTLAKLVSWKEKEYIRISMWNTEPLWRVKWENFQFKLFPNKISQESHFKILHQSVSHSSGNAEVREKERSAIHILILQYILFLVN